MTTHWYVAQLKPNGMHLATRNLGRQGFGVFCPQQSVARRVRGRAEQVRTPLFPGYLFVELAPGRGSWRAVNSTRGITRLISLDASGPRAIPPALIHGLRARCSEDGVLLPPDDFEVGEAVRLISGPFAGYISRIEALAPDERVWVLLDLLGRETRVAVAKGDLERQE